MRIHRGLLAGTGTSVSLIACAAVVLSVLSAFIAFDGWPGARASADVPPLALADGPQRTAGAPAVPSSPSRPAAPRRPIMLSAPPAPPAPGLAQTGTGGSRDGRLRRRGTRPGGRGASGPAADGVAPSREAASRRSEPDALRGAGDTIRDVARAGADVTREITHAPDAGVGPVAPSATQATGEAGRAVGDVVRQAGETAAGALQGAPVP